MNIGDEVVLSGRREFVIGEEDWIGEEVQDAQLLDFPAETLPVTVTKKTFAGKTVANIRRHKFMHGVSIRSIKRAGIEIPVLAQTKLDAGDVIEVVGTKQEVESAAVQIGICGPAYPPNGYDIRWIRYSDRWFVRCIIHPHRWCSHQSEYEWRRIDSRIILRLATQQASYVRTYPRSLPCGY